MIGFNYDSDTPASKAFISSGTLPRYIDRQQLPTKKKPFSTILRQPFTHTVELVLPEELYDLVWKDVEAKISLVQYSRVIMSLSEILEGDFFNSYLKTGNVLMLSEGRPGVDNQYSLKDGQLRIDLPKETYERTGLVGKPIRDGGRKHVKTRFSIEIDLRQPSMLHGKKGFERIVWAFKNVLNDSVTWLFHDLGKTSTTSPQPISKHHPTLKSISPQQKRTSTVLLPPLDPLQSSISNTNFDSWAQETYEWLSLVSLQSPRILASDTIDPFLSRYHVPGLEGDSESTTNMVSLTWTGLNPATWIQSLLVEMNAACLPHTTSAPGFFALSAHAFKTEVVEQQDEYTVLWLSGSKVGKEDPSTEKASGLQAVERERRGREFVLWELCCN